MRRCLIILLLIIPCSLRAQTGGDNTYEFLNLSTGALASSLGGINVSLITDDPASSFFNPALLSGESSGNISLNYINYIAGINFGYAAFAWHDERYGTFAGGVNYLNYGTIERSDPSGLITGKVKAAEYNLNLSWAYRIDSSLVAGINLKPVLSQLDSYSSIGLLFDAGISYEAPDRLFSAGLAARNIGFQLTTYNGIRESLPFEIAAGASLRLAHAPFRFSLTARQMQRYDMIHSHEELDNTGNERYPGISSVTENLMRHLILGVEFLPADNFFISGGFNYQRRKELTVEDLRSAAGFSFGAGIKLSGIELTLFTSSRVRYHMAGASTNISILLKPGLTGIFQ